MCYPPFLRGSRARPSPISPFLVRRGDGGHGRKWGASPADTADYSAQEARRLKELFETEVIRENYKKIDYPQYWCIFNRRSNLKDDSVLQC